VRAVIITIIFVFDPLAVLLLIAAQQTYRKLKPHEKKINWPKFTFKREEKLDNQPENDVPFKPYLDTSPIEIVPKEKIKRLDGGSF
jgi:hypothetical protein